MRIREGYLSEQIRNRTFEEILDDLGKRQKEVYDVIRLIQPCTNEQIARHLNKYPHVVTPRVLELRQLGVVEFSHEGKSPSNKPVSYWKLKKPELQTRINFN